jgi:hypothetical protein
MLAGETSMTRLANPKVQEMRGGMVNDEWRSGHPRTEVAGNGNDRGGTWIKHRVKIKRALEGIRAFLEGCGARHGATGWNVDWRKRGRVSGVRRLGCCSKGAGGCGGPERAGSNRGRAGEGADRSEVRASSLRLLPGVGYRVIAGVPDWTSGEGAGVIRSREGLRSGAVWSKPKRARSELKPVFEDDTEFWFHVMEGDYTGEQWSGKVFFGLFL